MAVFLVFYFYPSGFSSWIEILKRFPSLIFPINYCVLRYDSPNGCILIQLNLFWKIRWSFICPKDKHTSVDLKTR